MYSFIITAILGLIVSLCLFGKDIKNQLFNAAITIFLVVIGLNLIISVISLNYFDKVEDVRTYALVPIEFYKTPKDTIVEQKQIFIKGKPSGKTKTDTIINYSYHPVYFKIDKEGSLIMKMVDDKDTSTYDIKLDDIKAIREIKEPSRLEKVYTQYNNDGKWVLNALPPRCKDYKLALTSEQIFEYNYHLNKYKQDTTKNSKKLIASTNGK